MDLVLFLKTTKDLETNGKEQGHRFTQIRSREGGGHILNRNCMKSRYLYGERVGTAVDAWTDSEYGAENYS